MVLRHLVAALLARFDARALVFFGPVGAEFVLLTIDDLLAVEARYHAVGGVARLPCRVLVLGGREVHVGAQAEAAARRLALLLVELDELTGLMHHLGQTNDLLAVRALRLAKLLINSLILACHVHLQSLRKLHIAAPALPGNMTLGIVELAVYQLRRRVIMRDLFDLLLADLAFVVAFHAVGAFERVEVDELELVVATADVVHEAADVGAHQLNALAYLLDLAEQHAVDVVRAVVAFDEAAHYGLIARLAVHLGLLAHEVHVLADLSLLQVRRTERALRVLLGARAVEMLGELPLLHLSVAVGAARLLLIACFSLVLARGLSLVLIVARVAADEAPGALVVVACELVARLHFFAAAVRA